MWKIEEKTTIIRFTIFNKLFHFSAVTIKWNNFLQGQMKKKIACSFFFCKFIISIFNFSPSFHRFNSKVSYTHLKLLRTLVTRLSRILHAKIIYTPQIIAHQFFVCDMTTKFILYYYIYYYYYYIIHNTLSLCFLLNIETDRLGLVSSYHHELPIKPPLVYKTDIVCV